MVVLLSLTAALLGGSPGVVLVKGSAVGIPEQAAAAVLRTVAEALQERGVSTQMHEGACNADRLCLAKAAGAADVAAAVGVTMVRGRKDITVDLEAVDARERQLAVQTFSAHLKGRPFSGEAAGFFDALARTLATPRESDAPRVVDLASPHTSPERHEVAAAPPPRLRQVSAGAAAVGGVAALSCFIAGVLVKGDLDARLQTGPVVTGLTRDQAQGRAGLANGLFTGALISAAIAGVAGAAAAAFSAEESGSESE